MRPTDDPARSFDDFFAAEYRTVVALTAALAGRGPGAEELAQEAFVRAFRRWDRIAGYDDPAAWVRRVAANLATSTLRRRGREARALARVALRRPPVAAEPVDERFWAAVRALPRRQAQCVALHYLEDRSTAEIAVVLGIAEATVRVHLHDGRKRLASALDEEAT
ncbi:MAG: putative polymerase subfamily sigma factor [Actinomycetia bacterium]|nr:putative polymerase subfamily sigma factor [Actinomycetes bacterium]